MTPDDPRHGTYNGYHNQGCRCEPCTKANTAWHVAYRHRSGRNRPRDVYLAELRAQAPPVHGTESRYTRHGCRCEQCKCASRLGRARRRAAA